jgi:outer membrane receptor for ferric coprogen and ferric-rhodotorulic acid
MHRLILTPLALCSIAALAKTSTEPAPNEATLPVIRVKAGSEEPEKSEKTRSYTVRRSSSATGMDQTLRETPQSVSIVTRAAMDDFKLNNVNDVLQATTGVVVERVETDRTYYSARGFDIVNFQVDGLGLPMSYGLIDGDLDTAIYDRVEVIRGANGLMTGPGNPSATVNFVRKRATSKLQGSLGLTLGSWNDKRVDADIAGPLNASGSVRGRLVVAAQDKDSYLDRYHLSKAVVYGVVEADVGENTVLSAGHVTQRNRPRGNLWGALPLNFSDGTSTDYDVSTSTSPDWTYWKTNTAITFVEARHDFANGWHGTASFTHKSVAADSKLLYAYDKPDRSTGVGLKVWPSLYDLHNRQQVLDLRAGGPFTAWGREHEAIVGASTAHSTLRERSTFGNNIGDPIPDLTTWDGRLPEPLFNVDGNGSDFTDKQHSLYAAARLSATERLKVIAGANATTIKSSGRSYSDTRVRNATKVAPYIGGVLDLNSDWSVYASRTAIFNAQSQVGHDLRTLDPVTGTSLELGLKAELMNKQLNATLAVFKSRQDNLATSDGMEGVTPVYKGVDTLSQGVELDVAGTLAPGIKINAGYTALSIEDVNGNDARVFTPRHLLRLAGTWQVTDATRLGASLNWRSATTTDPSTGTNYRQPAYALVNLMLRHDIDKHWSITGNLENLTNRKYITSLYWSQGYYGAPRNGSVSLSYTY